MKRIIKYLIDRAVDRQQPLRGWTAWFVYRDVELQRYEKRMRAVDLRLRKDFDDHLNRPLFDRNCEGTPETRLAGRADSPSRRMRHRWIHAGLAVIVVAAIALPILISLFSKTASDTIVDNGHSPTIIDEPPKINPEKMFVENSTQYGDQLPSPVAWDEFRANLQREGQSVLDRIPRPLELIPMPDGDAICDSLSASNPVCGYLIASYVRPVFSSDSSAIRNSEREGYCP